MALGVALYLSRHTHQVDIDVYLIGGKHALSRDLYSVTLAPNRPFLAFTYPPFAALVFWPMAHALSVMSAQTVWATVQVGALAVLIAVTLRALRPDVDRRAIGKLSLSLLLPGLLLNPVFLTVGLGQINLVLCAAVLWDLCTTRRIGRFVVPRGVATGVAAAVKLTPLLFLPYLALTGQRRAAVVGSLSFALCSGLGFAATPRGSWTYWTHDVFASQRAGALFGVSDQNLVSTLSRFDHRELSASGLWPILALVGVAGLILANHAHRRSSPMLGVLVCATTALLISPISWAHHLVWVLPLILWLALANDRPRHSERWASGVALLFSIAPIWWVPHSWWPSAHPIELAERGWQLCAGNSFCLAMMLCLVGVAAMLWRRRPGRQRPSETTMTVSLRAGSPALPRCSSISGLTARRPVGARERCDQRFVPIDGSLLAPRRLTDDTERSE